jgi:antitoxin HigA-1
MEMPTMSKSSIITNDSDAFAAPEGGFRLRRSHPGRTIAQELAARDLSANALALKLRVPANRITEIINGKRGISPETALRLGRYLGTGAAFWLSLQSAYDLAEAEVEFGERVAREVQAA